MVLSTGSSRALPAPATLANPGKGKKYKVSCFKLKVAHFAGSCFSRSLLCFDGKQRKNGGNCTEQNLSCVVDELNYQEDLIPE